MNQRHTVGLTGDVMFRERLRTVAQDRWGSVDRALAILRGCDLVFINLEMPLTRRGTRTPKISNLRGDPDMVDDLLADGLDVNVASLANNHMLDYGSTGLFDTLETLDRAQIANVGAGHDLAEALRPQCLALGGRTIAFLAVATTLPPGAEAASDRPGIAPIRVYTSYDLNPSLLAEQPGSAPQVRTVIDAADLETVCEAIARAKREADSVVVAVHWGVTTRMITPFQGVIADYQPPMARALIDAGADVIVGHHPHRLDGIDFYRGKPILYSLGNFIFAAHRPHMPRETAMAQLEFGPDRADSSPVVRLFPLMLNAAGLPEIPEPAGVDRVFDVLCAASASFQSHLTRVGDAILAEPTASVDGEEAPSVTPG